MGINSSTPWSINDRQGFLTEMLYGSDAFFKISTLPYINNTTRNVLTVRVDMHAASGAASPFLPCLLILRKLLFLQVGENGLTVPIKVAYTIPAKRNLVSHSYSSVSNFHVPLKVSLPHR